LITVACVYKTDLGSRFWPSDVAALRDGIERHLTIPHRFLCLTDDEVRVMGFGIATIPLVYNLQGWWSKMELFALPGPVLYIDLDTVILGSLDLLVRSIIETEHVMVLRDFYSGLPASGVMGWGAFADLSWMLSEFVEDAVLRHYAPSRNGPGLHCKSGQYIGDQNWLRQAFKRHGVPLVYAQDLANGIYSYKVHVLDRGGPPDDATLVCFHGRPRINEIMDREPWLKDRVGLHSMAATR